MRCEKALEAIAESWGSTGPLPARVRRHLERCPSCARGKEMTERLLREAAGVEVPDPGEGYWSSLAPRIRRRIASLPARLRETPDGLAPPLVPFRRAFTIPLAAAAMVLVAALTWIARPTISPLESGEAEVGALRARFEETARRATAEERLLLEEMFLPGIGPDLSEREPVIDPVEIGDVAQQAAALLSPAPLAALPDLDEMLQGLTTEEIRELLEELSPAGSPPAGRAPEGDTG